MRILTQYQVKVISDKFSNNTLSIEELAKDIVEIAASEYHSVQDP